MNLSLWTSQAAHRHGDRIAIIDGSRQWTYREFEALVDRLASGLANAYEPGSRVAVMMHNRAEAVMLQFALERAGLVRVPVNFRYTAHELATLTAHCDAAALVHDAECAATVAAAGLNDSVHRIPITSDEWASLISHCIAPDKLHRASLNTLATINYTSGTTGNPKGVMLSHGNWAAVYRNMLVDRPLSRDDVVAYVGPMTHSSGAYLAPWYWRGARNIIVSPPTPANLADTIERERVTAFTCVPTFLTRFLTLADLDSRDFKSLRFIGYGAEAIPANTLERAWQVFGPILWQNYGQTEAMMTCAHLPPEDHILRDADGELRFRHGAIGRPYTFVEMVVRDKRGDPVASGEIGELTIRGEHVMQGYWEQPDLTAETVRDGWLWTGDLATTDEDGLIRLVGRRKDMLICGGFNIYPSEVESHLTALPGVLEAAVVAHPDASWGEIAVAYVVQDQPERWTADTLAAAMRPILGIKTPRAWRLVAELPKTNNGKIDKRRLQRDYADSLQSGDNKEPVA
ncbi:class I adenylate-forming enzyme family protein [Bordetella sp. 02P26C-1]|uniref:class I adenylate-forming enzyme family protein n=1 Tax=Bordetella sp. 02P26C-1 TaxID=2683195 RepID=UPI0013558A5B|nr:AMP-binding protein [Bordetella sp. 02P26C-1]MVW78104.1 AMP-binding protein [Bordetella sp. 02P26C-1]